MPGVTKIGDKTFNGCKGLNGNLVLLSKLKTIGEAAFQYTNLKGNITLPEGLTDIGKYAFSYSQIGAGQDLIIPKNITHIGASAFQRNVGIAEWHSITFAEGADLKEFGEPIVAKDKDGIMIYRMLTYILFHSQTKLSKKIALQSDKAN